MLADAFAAESFAFLKARGTIFWGVLFAPLVSLVLLLAIHTVTYMLVGAPPFAPAVAISGQMLGAVTGPAFLMAQPFFAITAMALFATNYRWETWRLVASRNSRANLMLGKLGVFAVAAAVGLALLTIVNVATGLFGSLLDHSAVVWSNRPNALLAFLLVFGIAWLELMVVAGLLACIAIVSRSQIGAILGTIGLIFVQAFFVYQMQDYDRAAPALKSMLLPDGAIRHLLDAVMLGQVMQAPLALGILIAWIVGLHGTAIWLFERQDLTRE